MSTSSSSSASSSSSESGAGELELNDWEGLIRDRGEEAGVYRPTRTATPAGGRVISYGNTPDATVWCLLIPASSEDAARYQRRALRVTHVAWSAEETAAELEGCRLKYGTARYYIHGVRDLLERGELWALDCEEVI